MLAKFDPIGKRRGWLNFSLEIETDFAADTLTPQAQPHYVADLANSFVDAHLLGLREEVRPTLERIIGWMEARPEPDQNLFSTDRNNWHDKWYILYSWRRTLGLCKWLSRSDRAEKEFVAALEVERQAWQEAKPEDVAFGHDERQDSLSERLAMALAGNVPSLGLELYRAAAVRRPTELQKPLLQFGHWACRHLADGGTRDETFIAKGAEMLRASLLPNFMWGGNRTEPALWLKAIYWDSGVAQTPEQAIARAYDSMPGVARPDFVPR